MLPSCSNIKCFCSKYHRVLDKSMQLPGFLSSDGTIKFIRTVDHSFDMLNSRSPIGKGFKTPLRLQSKDTWTEIFLTAAKYLMSMTTVTTPPQPVYTTQHKTFYPWFCYLHKIHNCRGNSNVLCTIQPLQVLTKY